MIASVQTRVEPLPLSRPYTIAFRTIEAVENVIVVLRDDAGRVGLGAASPEPHVTGETNEMCQAALADLDFLIGAHTTDIPALAVALERRMPRAPAARAAVDIALHDLLGHTLGASLGDLLGRCHQSLPTSITIGIKPVAETLAEADEYLGRGFRTLKVKICRSLGEDVERLAKLRERVGPTVVIRADANQGYTLAETMRFFDAVEPLDLEFLEQPVKAAATAELAALPEPMRARIAADESLLSPADAIGLATGPRPGIFNIKLMKCGGVRPAGAIAAVAEAAGISLMWGCMDESCISITAALHAALASPATRYLDLDGSFDLARDVAEGGFVVEDGTLRPLGGPGLGVRLKPG
jgi:L-alanine-DL-glutamate epimerase-like enolase superfamily enzyme